LAPDFSGGRIFIVLKLARFVASDNPCSVANAMIFVAASGHMWMSENRKPLNPLLWQECGGNEAGIAAFTTVDWQGDSLG
jgi:hypothetical protein